MTIIFSNTYDNCPECDGLGYTQWESPVQNMNLSRIQYEKCRCRTCGGTGRVPPNKPSKEQKP